MFDAEDGHTEIMPVSDEAFHMLLMFESLEEKDGYGKIYAFPDTCPCSDFSQLLMKVLDLHSSS